MNFKHSFYSAILISLALMSCSESSSPSSNNDNDDVISEVDNLEHSNDTDPMYEIVFDSEKVHRIDMTITTENWALMQADLETIAGGSTGGPGGGPGGGMVDETETATPIFIPADFQYEGITWKNIGVRYKGNSTLLSASKTSGKLPFRLDFDEFENDYPELKNQRFYGFKQISLSSGYKDDSFLHEKIAPEVFRDLGIPAPHTAFYRVYIDYGEGSTYFGLYTAVEIVDDTMIEDQFDNDDGNCYKPEGDAGTFAYGTYDEELYDKKTNEDEADFSDIKSFVDILNSSTRTTNLESWKDSLEAVFDVPHFMNWLAVNTVIQNWDTYGLMNHNFYLYNPNETGKLTWIPWDNNEAFSEGRGPLELDMSNLGTGWPLIEYLFEIDEYKTIYNESVALTKTKGFDITSFTTKVNTYAALIEPYVIGDDGEVSGYSFLTSDAAFTAGVDDLLTHVTKKHDAIDTYLATQ
jgi:spore coat protein H